MEKINRLYQNIYVKAALNLLLYTIVIIGAVYLYNPKNDSEQNQPKSKNAFVYQQF